MSRYHIALTAAAAVIAAGAVSACAPAAEKPWPNAAAGSSTPAVVKPTRWLAEVTPQPVPADQKDSAGYRFGPLAPGTGIWEHGDGVTTDAGCTAGPVVAPTTMSPRARGYLTAGHCDKPDRTKVITFSDAAHSSPQPVGVYTGTVDKGYQDSTVLWLEPGISAPVSIAGYPVAGLLTKAAVKDLPANTTLCVDGAVSGVICGPLGEADGDRIQIEVPTREGDSGGAVFLVSDTGAATLVGQVKKSSAKYTYATFLESALADQSAQLVVDRTAAAAVKGDPRYSDQVTSAS